uniref:NIF3-like protein 1 n=1 Tax=Callithrix jacchus TaxID=9483 RepID=A0A8I3VXV9_CALJA
MPFSWLILHLPSGLRLDILSAEKYSRTVRFIDALICISSHSFVDVKALLSSLSDFASLSFAESWDNVGFLVEPSPPHTVNPLFLTNDLTEDVMEEVLQKKADLILSYHPPIFRPMKRITWDTWEEHLVIWALENRVAAYSPHTAYDAAPQGVNNWLAKGLGDCTSRSLHPSKLPATQKVEAELLELERWRLQCAKIVPLHSSLGNRICLKKKKKKKKIPGG